MRIIVYDFRAIDIETLIGTIGGYIGLLLGYSILQVPSILSKARKRCKNRLRNKKVSLNSSSRIETIKSKK